MIDSLSKMPDVELWFKFRELNESGDGDASAYQNEIQRRFDSNPRKYGLEYLDTALNTPDKLYRVLVSEYEKLHAVPNDTEAKDMIKYYKQSAEIEGMKPKQIDEADSKARKDANLK